MPQIVIIGAGFGGLAVAIELKRLGIDSFTILERNRAVGGVWCANSYPGAACDVPSEIYAFSYALKPDWSRRFGSQPEIQAYLHEVADRYRLYDHIRFQVEVSELHWREREGLWRILTTDSEELSAAVVVCATGQLSRPRIPSLPGLKRFAGPQFHSAQWDHSVSLRGRRVAVVGSGASAIQIVPAIADQAAEVAVVQRSPNWIVPKYDWPQGRFERALMHLPAIPRLRHNLMWWKFELNVPLIWRWFDPIRRLLEWRLRRMIRRQVGDPQLARALTPTYKLGCNRVLLSNDWYPTLARPDVRVVTGGVERVFEQGLITADDTEVRADVVVWCTGFTPTEHLEPIRVLGRGGVELRERWRGGPEAYLGMTVPGFPNLFMVYGPNTGSLTNTIIFLLERQAAYIRQAIQHLSANGGSLEVRREVHDEFNRRLQRRLERTVFTTGCPGWYATEEGKVTTVWPGSHVSFARATKRFDPTAFVHVASPASSDRDVEPHTRRAHV